MKLIFKKDKKRKEVSKFYFLRKNKTDKNRVFYGYYCPNKNVLIIYYKHLLKIIKCGYIFSKNVSIVSALLNKNLIKGEMAEWFIAVDLKSKE